MLRAVNGQQLWFDPKPDWTPDKIEKKRRYYERVIDQSVGTFGEEGAVNFLRDTVSKIKGILG